MREKTYPTAGTGEPHQCLLQEDYHVKEYGSAVYLLHPRKTASAEWGKNMDTNTNDFFSDTFL